MLEMIPKAGHSAKVRLWLEVGSQTIRLSHVGPDYVIAREPATLPPCDATVVFEIDDTRYERQVHLANGLDPARSQTVTVAR